MDWNYLKSIEELDRILLASFSTPQIIYKHSSRCYISSMVKFRLESDWNFGIQEITTNFLDIIKYKNVSQYIAEKLQIPHESPQIILIHKGETVYDESHQEIFAAELESIHLN